MRVSGGAAVVRQPVVVNGNTVVVVTEVPRSRLRRGVTRAWSVLSLMGLVLVGLSLVVADRLARSLTRPISELAHTAERLGAGDLTARTVPGGPDEVREVGVAVNLLAARIGSLLAHERESVADLSHRLRTPITALRLDVDSLADSPERDRLAADVDELTRQVDAVINEARRPVREGVEARADARAVTQERVDFWAALTEDQGREVSLALPTGPCIVRAAEDDLAAALDALIGNVVSHTPEGSAMHVVLTAERDGSALLLVDDGGAGFADSSVVGRGRSGAGSTGLGLDIARRTATASGGDLRIGRSPAGGARVSMRLGGPSG